MRGIATITLGTAMLAGALAYGTPGTPAPQRDPTEAEIGALAAAGRPAIPRLREIFLGPDRHAAELAARAIGKIQGQWGATGEGVFWERSFERACERARRERKLVLLLELSGNFDEEFC